VGRTRPRPRAMATAGGAQARVASCSITSRHVRGYRAIAAERPTCRARGRLHYEAAASAPCASHDAPRPSRSRTIAALRDLQVRCESQSRACREPVDARRRRITRSPTTTPAITTSTSAGVVPLAPELRPTAHTASTCRCRTAFVRSTARQRQYRTRAFGHARDLIMLDGRQYRSSGCDDRPARAGRARDVRRRANDARRPAGAVVERRHSARVAPVGRCSASRRCSRTSTRARQRAPLLGDNWERLSEASRTARRPSCERKVRNPVILSGDIHAFLVNDVNTRAGEPDSASSRPSS